MNNTNIISEQKFSVILKRALHTLDDYDVKSDTNITSKTKLREDLNLDSLDIINVIMRLEQKYNIDGLDDNYFKMLTVADLNKSFTESMIKKQSKILPYLTQNKR